jgi:hypothetical protein
MCASVRKRCRLVQALRGAIALLLMCCGIAVAAAGNPCDSVPHRAFDFWVGDWVVTLADGREAGRNRIERDQAGCVLVERWQGAAGGSGLSMNYYDRAAGVWRQVWISPQSQIDLSGGMSAISMELEGTITYLDDGRSLPFRGTWTPLDDGRVRQYFEESREPGQWTPWFEGFYRRLVEEPSQ